MGVVITPESELGQELAKWNKPYRYEEYPRLMYRAARKHNGQWAAHEPPPHPYGYATDAEYQRAVEMAEAFNRGCQLKVFSDDEYRAALNQGWRKSITEAEEAHAAREEAISTAAAERAYRDRNMSEKAQAEVADAEREAGLEHVLDVPVPKRGPGRPRKEPQES